MNKTAMLLAGFVVAMACAAHADRYEDLLVQGIALLKDGKPASAVSVLQQAASEKTDASEPYYYLGLGYFSQGDYQNAAASLLKAVEKEPGNAAYHRQLASVYRASGDYENALKRYDEAVKVAPGTMQAAEARKEKSSLLAFLKERELTASWARRAEEVRLATATVPTQATPAAVEGTAPAEGLVDESGQPLTVARLLKRVKFGTDSQRKAAAELLATAFRGDELKPFAAEFVPLMQKPDAKETRMALIRVVGKTGVPESYDALFALMTSSSETFDYKLMALASLGAVRTDRIVESLRGCLSGLVDRREQIRQTAQARLSTLRTEMRTIDDQLTSMKETIDNLTQRKAELEGNFSMAGLMPDGSLPPDISMMPINPMLPDGRPITGQMVRRWRDEYRNATEQLEQLTARSQTLSQRRAAMLLEQMRLDSIVARYESNIQVPETILGKVPPEIPQMSDEAAEQVFALLLIRQLGKLRDVQGLPVIRRAWAEYKSSFEEIQYGLTLARLGDYSMVEQLLARMRADFPEDMPAEAEVSLRAGIVEILGEYLRTVQRPEVRELIAFLADDCPYAEIKSAAIAAAGSSSRSEARR